MECFECFNCSNIVYTFSVDVMIDDALTDLAEKSNVSVDHLLTTAVIDYLVSHRQMKKTHKGYKRI
mgnify:CR=1 FL=1